jgi:hypothetical protein
MAATQAIFKSSDSSGLALRQGNARHGAGHTWSCCGGSPETQPADLQTRDIPFGARHGCEKLRKCVKGRARLRCLHLRRSRALSLSPACYRIELRGNRSALVLIRLRGKAELLTCRQSALKKLYSDMPSATVEMVIPIIIGIASNRPVQLSLLTTMLRRSRSRCSIAFSHNCGILSER